MGLAVSLLLASAPAGDNAGAELTRLAQALRANPSEQNYARLARFAADTPRSEWSAQAEFALGMADFEEKRWPTARARFRAARASRWLRDYASLYLARTEAQMGDLDAARRGLEVVSFAGSRLDNEARVLKANLAVRGGRAQEAVQWLKQLPELGERPALLLALAQAQESAGEVLAAVETLHRIYYEFPLSPEAEPSNELLARLRSIQLKADYPAPDESLRRTRAEKLWAQQAYRGARSAYVDLSVRASEPTRREARGRAALALYLLGAARAACAELARIRSVPPELAGEFRSYRVRCGVRAGPSPEVDADLAFLAARFPASEWYEGGLLAAANTALARGDIPRARDYYRRLVEAFPRGEAAAQAHWKLAWLAYRDGETAAAAALMEEHLERFPESIFVPRALYWRARLATAAGDELLAQRLLAVLREWAPRDYWAQQAEGLERHWRGAPAGNGVVFPAWLEKLSKPPLPPPTLTLSPAVRAQVEKAAVFERLGLWELASGELEAAVQQQPHPEIRLVQARIALAQQQYARATETVRRAYPAYWHYRLEELPRAAWEILFPRPYWEAIEREARRQRLDPYLVAALIRQESRFEAQAVSSAGALGLMQLMPGTARYLARRRRLAQSRILDSAFNIRLGTGYLAQLLRRFGGNLEKAVAAYNGGGTRVSEWAAQGAYPEPAEFVESIPVTQTREFVYKVLRNYRFYRDLYAEQ
ncbi:MAG: transglycosylase SLT domain-containing protein [Terriglobia bacterium]